jgi:hypothetical protein
MASKQEAEQASIQVAVRLRPLNGKEKANGTLPVVTASHENREVTVIKGSGNRQIRSTFAFANVFGSFTTQEEM